jgi:hypothetical protein
MHPPRARQRQMSNASRGLDLIGTGQRPRRAQPRDEPVDRDLVEAARKRGREACADLIRVRGDHLHALARRILRDVDRAEDVLQEALVIAWRPVWAPRHCHGRGSAQARAAPTVELFADPNPGQNTISRSAVTTGGGCSSWISEMAERCSSTSAPSTRRLGMRCCRRRCRSCSRSSSSSEPTRALEERRRRCRRS